MIVARHDGFSAKRLYGLFNADRLLPPKLLPATCNALVNMLDRFATISSGEAPGRREEP